jgi:predicted dehydrogenase
MLRWGVVGVKGIGQYHLRAAHSHPQIRVTAVADLDAEAAEAAARSTGARAYTDHRDLLAAGEVDVVSVAVPHAALAPIAADCLRAGCHVLVEKPLARHTDEAAELLRLAQAHRRRIAVAYQYRTYATPLLLKQVIESGQIGQVQQVIWTWNEFRPHAYYARAGWRASWEGAGGGLLMNQISHDVDLLRWLVGDVESVSAHVANHTHATPLDDALAAALRFRNGALGVISAAINSSGAHNTRQIIGTHGLIVIPNAKPLAHNPNDRILIGRYAQPNTEAVTALSGDHGQIPVMWRTLYSRPSRRWERWAKRIRRLRLPSAPVQPASGHGRIVWDMAEANIEDRAPLVTGEDAYRTLDVINALLLAALDQRTVSLPLDPQVYRPVYEALVRGERTLTRGVDLC